MQEISGLWWSFALRAQKNFVDLESPVKQKAIRWSFSTFSGLDLSFRNRLWLRQMKLGSLIVFDAFARRTPRPLLSRLELLEVGLPYYYQEEAARGFVPVGMMAASFLERLVFQAPNLGRLRFPRSSLNHLPQILLYL